MAACSHTLTEGQSRSWYWLSLKIAHNFAPRINAFHSLLASLLSAALFEDTAAAVVCCAKGIEL